MCMPGAQKRSEGASDLQRLLLKIISSHHVGAWGWTINRCSLLLIHYPVPRSHSRVHFLEQVCWSDPSWSTLCIWGAKISLKATSSVSFCSLVRKQVSCGSGCQCLYKITEDNWRWLWTGPPASSSWTLRFRHALARLVQLVVGRRLSEHWAVL